MSPGFHHAGQMLRQLLAVGDIGDILLAVLPDGLGQQFGGNPLDRAVRWPR